MSTEAMKQEVSVERSLSFEYAKTIRDAVDKSPHGMTLNWYQLQIDTAITAATTALTQQHAAALSTQAAQHAAEVERLKLENATAMQGVNEGRHMVAELKTEVERLTRDNEILRGDFKKAKANATDTHNAAVNLRAEIAELKAQLTAAPTAEAIEKVAEEIQSDIREAVRESGAVTMLFPEGWLADKLAPLFSPGAAERPVVGVEYEGAPKGMADWVAVEMKAGWGLVSWIKHTTGDAWVWQSGGEDQVGETLTVRDINSITAHRYLTPPAVPEEGLVWEEVRDECDNSEWRGTVNGNLFCVVYQCLQGNEVKYWIGDCRGMGMPDYPTLEAAKAACEAHWKATRHPAESGQTVAEFADSIRETILNDAELDEPTDDGALIDAAREGTLTAEQDPSDYGTRRTERTPFEAASDVAEKIGAAMVKAGAEEAELPEPQPADDDPESRLNSAVDDIAWVVCTDTEVASGLYSNRVAKARFLVRDILRRYRLEPVED